MHTQNKFEKLLVRAITGSLLFSLSTLATAESDAARAVYLSAANVPTNIVGINTYPDPPKGFNPLTASDVELATYGFPQRPDKEADPDHYALWERAMMAAKIRWHGELKTLPSRGHGMTPTRSSSPAPGNVQPLAGPSHQSNVSASGITLNSGRTTWSNTYSFNSIWATASVPTVEMPLANSYGCTAEFYDTVSLVGIDGQIIADNGLWAFMPEENAGVWEEYDCGYGVAYYNAYIGWGNNDALGFPMNPGDVAYIVVDAYGGCNNGYAFVQDLTTYTYGSYTISNPCYPGPQIGRYAVWAVWRPCCNGPGPVGAWPLANTVGTSFQQSAVQIGSGKQFFPGSQATTTQILTMTDDGNTQNIEVVNQGTSGYQGSRSLYFQTWGCAYYGGCNP